MAKKRSADDGHRTDGMQLPPAEAQFERLTFAREFGGLETALAAGSPANPEPVASAMPLTDFANGPYTTTGICRTKRWTNRILAETWSVKISGTRSIRPMLRFNSFSTTPRWQ
jgi:hypothetical protein